MSQSTEKIELNIEVVLTLDDHREPQAIAVSGTGNIPRSGVRAIAEEALESHFGSVDHDFRVQTSPVEEGEQGTVFEVYKRVHPALRRRQPEPLADWELELLNGGTED